MKITEKYAGEGARDYALRTLKDNIVLLELEPGSLLSEKELADELKLSRTPVREALIELGKVGIVEIYPQKGSRISKIDYSMVEEAQFMRLVLETAVIEMLCDGAASGNSRNLGSLEENLRCQVMYLENHMPQQLLDMDNKFHKEMFDLCGKSQIYSLMNSMMIHFDRVRNMSLVSVKNIKIVEDHTQILQAIKDGDKAKGKAAMEKHLYRYKVDEGEIRAAYPNYFK